MQESALRLSPARARQPLAFAQCAPQRRFSANGGRRGAQPCTSVSRPRIRFVALCVGLDTGASAAIRQRYAVAGGLAATFLKHKLWRIRNTRRRELSSALSPESQVIDRPMLCLLEDRLARLLLVDNH